MFKLSRAVEYSIIFLISLNKAKGVPVSLTKASKTKGLPLKYLEKIAQQLKTKKIIKSKEGTKGGYLLTKKTSQISLKQIITAVEGNKGLVSCIHGQCDLSNICSHRSVWLKLNNVLTKELEKITLKDFL